MQLFMLRNLGGDEVIRILLFAAAMGASSALCAGQFATYQAGKYTVILMTDKCSGNSSGISRRAFMKPAGGAIDGCWWVNGRDNPVVTWTGGRIQELNAEQVRLQPRYALAIQEQPAAAAGPSFARPEWCKNARQPYELAVCGDRELASNSMQLGTLWRAFRAAKQLDRMQEARYRSEYLGRLKACKGVRGCVANEQSARMRIYREALASR